MTTIIQIADPLMPVFFTREATKEAYFPEWLQTGTGLTDTTFFGRTYDQTQWAHAFGISPLWVFWENLKVSEGYREYHHMCPFVPACGPVPRARRSRPASTPTEPASRSSMHRDLRRRAEPQRRDLRPGHVRLPTDRWGPPRPADRLHARTRPTAIKDFVEIYWDNNRRGKDEVNGDGQGMLLKVNNGKRYKLGQWPTNDPQVLGDAANPVFTSDAPYTDPKTRRSHEEDGHKHDPAKKCLSC